MDRPTVVAVWPGCAWQEVAPAVALLSEARAVWVASPRGEAVRVREGYRLAPDGALDAAPAPAELLVPGGALDAVWDDDAARAGLAALFARAERTGAVCNGVPFLARAAGLAGRRVTHTCVPRYAPRPAWSALLDAVEPALAGATYVDEDVVVDGGLVTARPWAALAFARALAAPVLGREPAARAARYLAGERDLPDADPYERWVVLLDTLPGVATPREVVAAHVAWLEGLEADGRLAAAGPFPEDASGMVVLRVGGRADAEALAASDPFVRAGVRRASIRRWTLSCAQNGHLGVSTR